MAAPGRRYIIDAPKSELKKFAGSLAAAAGWRTVREGVKVKLARCPDTGETMVPCRSADREAKERAMHDKFSGRIEAALERLAARNARSKKRLDREQVNRQIGRILQQSLVPDRTHLELILLDAKGRFGLRDLDVGLRQFLIAPAGGRRGSATSGGSSTAPTGASRRTSKRMATPWASASRSK